MKNGRESARDGAPRVAGRDRTWRGNDPNKGTAGELYVMSQLERMGFDTTLAGGKHPLIDAYVQLREQDTGRPCYLTVQVKTGKSFLIGKPDRHLHIRLNKRDVDNWLRSTVPVIVVWVDDRKDALEAFWAEAKRSRVGTKGGKTLKIPKAYRLTPRARERLLKIAGADSGRNITKLKSHPLPNRVKEFKPLARAFFDEWRREGSWSPSKLLNHVDVPLDAWRHLTKVSRSPQDVIHRLSLLPCAREILERTPDSTFMRDLPTSGWTPRGCSNAGNGIRRELRSVSGIRRVSHRSDALIEVVVEVARIGKHTLGARLRSVRERGSTSKRGPVR